MEFPKLMNNRGNKMRKKRIIEGLNNSQKIRVIINGVGFNTTVNGMTEMCFTEQRSAVWLALNHIGREKIQGFAGQTKVYDAKMNINTINYQVNLL
jgi:hypothetical protein